MNKLVPGAAGFALGLLTATAVSPIALAQDARFEVEQNVGVKERARPEYDARGVRAGAFEIRPRLSLDLVNDDNIFRLDEGGAIILFRDQLLDGENLADLETRLLADEDADYLALRDAEAVSDTIVVFSPSVTLQSNWARHSLSTQANIRHEEFSDNGDESATDIVLRTNGRLDVGRDTVIIGTYAFENVNEQRALTGTSLRSLERVEVDRQLAALGVEHTLNRLKFAGQATLRDLDFTDGVDRVDGSTVEQDLRDQQVLNLRTRTSYALSPDTAVFGEVSFSDRKFDFERPVFVNGVETTLSADVRDVETLVGAEFDVLRFVRGEVGVGLLTTDFDDNSVIIEGDLTDADPTNDQAIGGIDGSTELAVNAAFEWFPSQVTTVKVNARRALETEAGLSDTPGSVSLDTGLIVDHELLRNFIVTGEFLFERDEFQGIEREDQRLGLGLSGTYLLNRNVGLTGFYALREQDSDGIESGVEYTANRIGVGLELQY